METVVDTREQYAYRFAPPQVRVTKRALPCGDYGVTIDGRLIGALRQGHTVRRGQGYSLYVSAAPYVHHALRAAAAPLGADGAASAAIKAYRIDADRLTAAAILTDPAR